jgi:hypothetical protein
VPSDEWIDDDAGPLVRPYAVTRGRTRPGRGDFDLIAIIASTPGGLPSFRAAGPEHQRILDLCRNPLSVAEICSEMDLALGVVRILLDDLDSADLIVVRRPAPVTQLPSERVLKEVIDGLEAL